MNPVKPRRLRRTAAQWHNIVEAQLASGLSAPKFCQAQSISYPSFMNWKKKLTSEMVSSTEKALPTFIELTPDPDEAVPVAHTPDSHALNIELDLGAGIQLRILRAG